MFLHSNDEMAASPSLDHGIRRHHFFNRDGMRLAASIGGDPHRSPVILLHGGGQTRHSWDDTMQELVALGYYVINLDARGHGESDWSETGDYALDTMADDLLDVSATLPALPALVGASMGGLTAMCAVWRSLNLVARALVLVDVVPRGDSQGVSRILAFMRGHPEGFATVEEAADAVAAYNPARPRPRDLGGLMKNLRRRTDDRLYWHWDPRLVDTANFGDPSRQEGRLRELCHGSHVPTMLVRSVPSEVVTSAGVQELRERLPQLEVFDVPSAGHMVAGDRNDVFNDGVLDFLKRHYPHGTY